MQPRDFENPFFELSLLEHFGLLNQSVTQVDRVEFCPSSPSQGNRRLYKNLGKLRLDQSRFFFHSTRLLAGEECELDTAVDVSKAVVFGHPDFGLNLKK